MKLDEVTKRVQKIRDCAGDDEAAHSYEDSLYADVLQAIATDDLDESPQVFAAAALEAELIEFERWCG